VINESSSSFRQYRMNLTMYTRQHGIGQDTVLYNITATIVFHCEDSRDMQCSILLEL